MLKLFSPFRFNLFLFSLSLLLNLCIPFNHTQWHGLSDPYDYLYQSKIPLNEKEFYFPHKTPGFYPRPFTVPLIYKIAGSNHDTIVALQRIIHTIITFLLAYSLSLFLARNFLKYLIIFFIYFLMSWWNILGWASILLSESLSISFLFLWIATLLIFVRFKNWLFFLLHLIVILLFSFTRDTWPYLLLLFYLALFVLVFLYNKQFLKWTVFLFIYCLIIFFIQNKSSEIGNRTKLPLINTILVRIVPKPEYFDWMVKREMPMAEKLQHDFKNLDIKNDSCRIRVYELYNDSSYNDFFNWITTKGKKTYMYFMVTHPDYFLLLNERQDDLKRIFSYNLSYSGSVKGYSWGAQKVFPIFNLVFIFISAGVLVFIFYKTKEIIYIIPLIIFLILIFNIFLSYNADAFEVERHLFFTHIIIQFLGIFSTAFILDYLVTNLKSLKSNTFFKSFINNKLNAN